MYKYDLCIYCVIIVQDNVIPTYVVETTDRIYSVNPLNIDQLVSGKWTVHASGGDTLPMIAVCTSPWGGRLCSLHAMTESKDPRNRLPNGRDGFHPYPDRRYSGPGM